jgi:cadmium resistance protein CadD (predicted permease)
MMFFVSFGVLVFLQVAKIHLGLIPLILGLKTIRGALEANLSRAMIRT